MRDYSTGNDSNFHELIIKNERMNLIITNKNKLVIIKVIIIN